MSETITNNPKKLLLIDDDPNLILLVQDYLEFRGYAVITAENGREALDILIDQAKTTCGYIDDGDSKSDIIWIITLAAEQSNSSQEIVDAFLAASVAATFVYCPEYQGFWDQVYTNFWWTQGNLNPLT